MFVEPMNFTGNSDICLNLFLIRNFHCGEKTRIESDLVLGTWCSTLSMTLF